MKIGIPKEVKTLENRVGLTPGSVRELSQDGHTMFVESGAGLGIGADDQAYIAAGASIVADAQEVFRRADLIVKVKEPQPQECAMLEPRHVLFTYLHLAADRAQTDALLSSGATCIAYETVTSGSGGLPLLAPMSEVAGRMSIQVASWCLEKRQGGGGMLLGGVPGVRPAKVVILGGGVSGSNAAAMAVGLGADVTVLDKSLPRLRELDALYGPRLKTSYATLETVESAVLDADVVIGAVLIPGAAAPRLVTASHVNKMRPGAVLVDISIDQGGCFETSRPTSHADPIYLIDGVVHYCVTNMPGAVPRTSAYALNNATLPHVRSIAAKGAAAAMASDKHLLQGLNISSGKLTHAAVAAALGIPHQNAEMAL